MKFKKVPNTLATATLIALASFSLSLQSHAKEAMPVQNACPKDGCMVKIVSAEPADKELKIKFEANFDPDVARNHIHIYWDNYTADQVTKDAVKRGVEQGNWHPTGDYPDYITQSDASVSVRKKSTTLCVTASDRDHVVIDASTAQCFDVADKL